MADNITKTKRSLIDNANTTMVASIAVAGFLVMFAIVSGRALFSQRNYQARVIGEKEKAVQQLQENIKSVDKLAVSYKEFTGAPNNVLGGNPTGSGERDGNNAKLVLDALPSKYDFPALVTSIEKILTIKKYQLEEIDGKDDEINQKNASSKDPVEMPFELKSNVSDYKNLRDLLVTLEQSIRPIQVKKLTISSEDQLSANIEAVSYFKPARGLEIGKKVVK